MKKVILRVFLFVIITPFFLVGVLIFSKAVSYYFGPESLGPRNAVELCNALGRDPDSDPMCNFQRVGDLLRDTFPIGEATVDDVHDKLGVYWVGSHDRAIGGTRVTYAIQRFICCLFRPEADFTFNEDGILTSLSIMD